MRPVCNATWSLVLLDDFLDSFLHELACSGPLVEIFIRQPVPCVDFPELNDRCSCDSGDNSAFPLCKVFQRVKATVRPARGKRVQVNTQNGQLQQRWTSVQMCQQKEGVDWCKNGTWRSGLKEITCSLASQSPHTQSGNAWSGPLNVRSDGSMSLWGCWWRIRHA